MQPKLLVTLSGERIRTAEEWEKYKKEEIKHLFEHYVYGAAPAGKPESLTFECDGETVLGEVIFKKIKITVDGFSFYARAFYPREDKPLPTFVYMMHNFQRSNSDIEHEPNCEFVPIRDICKRGYAVIVFYTVEIYHDNLSDTEYEGSIFANYSRPRAERDGDEWSAVSAWAFCASRIMDYVTTDPTFDKDNVAIVGHSRGGKTALWTGAIDPRFSFVVSNSSGCMGAAMLRGKRGEHLDFITAHTDWFCKNLDSYVENEEMLPVDQHMLLAMIAPRLLYIESNSEDEWADPTAERLSARLASEVYSLYGRRGVVLPDEPLVENERIYHDGAIGYHMSDGAHRITATDWDKFIEFWENKRSRK